MRAFQRMTASIKFCPRPVVVAPFGFCLGGGAEIALHGVAPAGACRAVHGAGGDRRRPAAGGGGCKEMTLRAMDAVPDAAWSESRTGALRRTSRRSRWRRCRRRRWRRGGSASLPPGDRITMNRERLLIDAKELARDIAGRRLRGRRCRAPISRRRARTCWRR